MEEKKRNPWLWIPTLYIAEGLPYVAVTTISVIVYKRLGISNTDIALYTGWLYLPWVIKPFWSPFVDLIKSKRWWTVMMQALMAVAFACIAFSLPSSLFFQLSMAAFWLVAFTSATHDIAADGYYMHALSDYEQSLYVGIRSTFYRIATVTGQGVLVIIAGLIEMNTGLSPAIMRIDASPKEVVMTDVSEVNIEEQHFVFHKVERLDSSVSLLDYAKQQNVLGGFVEPEEKKEEVEIVTEESVFTKWGSAFTKWVHDTFGEDLRPSVVQYDRQMLVGVCLAKYPVENELVVLNMAFKKGDQSIRIHPDCTRFTFTRKNWNKPAIMLVSVDAKLKGKTSAIFEGLSGNIPYAWLIVFTILSLLFLLISFYHQYSLPYPVSDHPNRDITPRTIINKFILTFKTFFSQKQALAACLFMLLYRLPEAQLVKIINPFMLDPIDRGGLGLTTGEVGFVYGTIGIIGLTVGGILGGIAVAHDGLKKWFWPMALAITLPDLVYVYLSYIQPTDLFIINVCIFIEQFGYGFGFTAYMLYLIYYSEGEHKTAHYAICTGFMALGMMLPGMMAGWLQETIGYRHFFIWTIICCLVTFIVCAFLKIDSRFGKKE